MIATKVISCLFIFKVIVKCQGSCEWKKMMGYKLITDENFVVYNKRNDLNGIDRKDVYLISTSFFV